MARVDQNPSVRPLDSGPPEASRRREPRPPQLKLVVMLLATGGLIGWLVGSTGGGDTIASPVADSDEAELAPLTLAADTPAEVEWIQATDIPATPSGMEYAGVSNVVEVAGTIYVVVNWRDPETDEELGHLWISGDGREWRAEPIEVGRSIAVDDIEGTRDGLLLVGWSDDEVSLWRSVPRRAIGGSSWVEVPLDIPDTVRPNTYATAATSDGDIMVVMGGHLDVASEVIEPYLPVDIDLEDDKYTYDGDRFIYTSDPPSSIQVLDESPQVVVGDERAWIRLVTLDGEEILQTVPLPEGIHPAFVESPAKNISLTMAWAAAGGGELRPLIGENVLPTGFFHPEAWGDGFVAALYGSRPNEEVTLWESQSGRVWRPLDPQPPRKCLPFQLTVSGDRILLAEEGGLRCARDSGTEWAVIGKPSESAYVVGGPAGFIGYPNAFEYDAALFSQDGLSWEKIGIPGLAPYPTLSILDERLMVLSVGRPRATGPLQIGIWLGKPAA